MQPYELIRSGRRTLALEVRGGRVIVRAPYRTCLLYTSDAADD